MKKSVLRYQMVCLNCGKPKPHDQNLYKCPHCNGLFMPVRDEKYIRSVIGHGRAARAFFDRIRYSRQAMNYPYNSGIFRWLDYIMPGFPLEAVLSLNESRTDLFQVPEWLRKKLDLMDLWIKLEGLTPSGSFKDRGMFVAVSEIRRLQIEHPELGIDIMACASTGDTASSAAVAAAYIRNLIRCLVLLPWDKITPEQLVQTEMFGAIVLALKHKDGFDGCYKLIDQYCSAHKNIVLVNSANAYRLMGQETIALGIFQDLRWKAPRWISIPCGNGGNLTALLLSCWRALQHGLIDRLPGIIVAQPERANTLVRWVRSSFTDYSPGQHQETLASAMNIQNPVSFPRIKSLYEKFEILAYDVCEPAIQQTRAQFNLCGADVCPQGAVALNAIIQARAAYKVRPNDTVVAISTATGLKFTASALEHHMNGSPDDLANPYRVVKGATLESMEAAIKLAR